MSVGPKTGPVCGSSKEWSGSRKRRGTKTWTSHAILSLSRSSDVPVFECEFVFLFASCTYVIIYGLIFHWESLFVQGHFKDGVGLKKDSTYTYE